MSVPHGFILQLCTARSDLDHEAHDRVAVRFHHPLGRTDRIALNESPDDLSATGERKAVHNNDLNKSITKGGSLI